MTKGAASTGRIDVSFIGETIETAGAGQNRGIYIEQQGAGASQIDFLGVAIKTAGDASHGIHADITNVGAAGNVLIQATGRIETKGAGADGILVTSVAQSGDVKVVQHGNAINLEGVGAHGIYVSNTAASSASNILVAASSGQINLLQNATMGASSGNYGILAELTGATSSGNVTVSNINTTIDIGAGNGSTQDSSAIYAQIGAAGVTTGTGHVRIENSAALTTRSESTTAEHAVVAGYNWGAGDVTVLNTGEITAYGSGTYGLHARAYTGGAVEVTSTAQNINISGTNHAHAVAAVSAVSEGAGNATANISGNINNLNAGVSTDIWGIEVSSRSGSAYATYANGVLQSYGQGIVLHDGGSGTGISGEINVGSNATVKSLEDFALYSNMGGGNTVNTASSARLEGEKGIGMNALAGASNTINHYGVIDVLSDFAVSDTSAAGSTTAINNSGTITGYITAGDGDATFTNYSSNSWNMRNFIDTDGDGARDTKAVALSDFGAGNDAFVNTATGTVRLAAVDGASTNNTAGEYVPVGALSTSNSGIVQGQLLNLNRFENAGMIDLSGNGLAGDVMVITAGSAPGSNGGGTYVSNGGSVKLDSVLNEGAANSLSDILVVDNVTLGSGATGLLVTASTGSTGELTTGDGIKVVEVLGTQDAGSFTLGAPVSYGSYEYILANGSGGNANNWYLINNVDGEPIINPGGGGVLVGLDAGANMFNINVSAGRNRNLGSQPDKILWFTANRNELKSDLFGGKQRADIKTNIFQLGADVIRQDGYVLGVYAGYGDSSIHNKSRQSGSSANGKVTGYHVGLYGGWKPEEDKGPYVDAWGYYGRFDNKLKGSSQRYRETKYNSTGYSFAGETGYGFEVSQQANGNAWVVEPHVGFSYTRLKADSFYDSNLTRYSSLKSSGIQTRLGVRGYGNLRTQNQHSIKPYIDVAWVHNGADRVVSMNGAKLSSDIGKDVGEVKIGLQGNLTERFSMWGHLGAQRGSGNFKRHEIEIGIGWSW